MQMFIWMNFSECLSNSNKHLFAVKVFYACCLNSADTPASSATRRDQLHFAVRKGEAGRDFSKFGVIISTWHTSSSAFPTDCLELFSGVWGQYGRGGTTKFLYRGKFTGSTCCITNICLSISSRLGWKLLLPSENILEVFLLLVFPALIDLFHFCTK